MKKLHILALFVIAIAISSIVINAGDYSTYATFTEAEKKQGKFFQVNGNLCELKEFQYDPVEDPNYFSFCMVDKAGTEKKVVYHGAMPQDFERSEEVVLQGAMKGDEFVASKILLKCPSKYNDGELEERSFESGKTTV